MNLAIRAAGAVLQYLQETQPTALKLLTSLSTYSLDEFMTLDVATPPQPGTDRNNPQRRGTGLTLERIGPYRYPHGPAFDAPMGLANRCST